MKNVKKFILMIAASVMMLGVLQTQSIARIIGNTAIKASAAGYTCKACGQEFTHSAYQKPTCTVNGKKEYWYHYCKSEGTVVYQDGIQYGGTGSSYPIYQQPSTAIPATGHSEVVDIAEKAATCTTDGNKVKSHCRTCGAQLGAGETIPATGHSEVVDIAEKAATCTTDGNKVKSHCETCSAQLGTGETIPSKGGHNIIVDEEAVEPTCTTEGRTEVSHCSVCGEQIGKGETVPVCHSFEDGICTICETHEIINGKCGDTATYTLDKATGFLTVSGTGTIYDNAFWRGVDFSEEYIIDVVIEDGITGIGEWAFSGNSELGTVVIPSSVTSIGDMAFANCLGLVGVKIPSSVTTIGQYAFNQCEHLRDIEIPSSVTDIGAGAFFYCFSLRRITIPSSVTTINDMTFANCWSLQSIEIPSSVTSIGEAAFGQCLSLRKVKYDGTSEQWDTIAISNYNDNLVDAERIFKSQKFTGASLILDGTINVKLCFDGYINEGDWTINGKSFATTDETYIYESAAKDYMEEIVIKHGDDTVFRFSVHSLISNYTNSSDENVANLATALEAYCKAAKAYFGGATVTDYSDSYDSIMDKTGRDYIITADNYIGTSLLLKSTTVLRHYYSVDAENDTAPINQTKYGYYYVDETVPAANFGAGGTYCVNDYIYQALASSRTSNNLKNLCVALYKYGEAAQAYLSAVE